MATMHFPQSDDESERAINYSVPPTSREDGEETPIIEQGKKVAADVARFGFRLTKVGGHYAWKTAKVLGKYGWNGTKVGVVYGKKSAVYASKKAYAGAKKGVEMTKSNIAPRVVEGGAKMVDYGKKYTLPAVKTYFKELVLSATVAGTFYAATEYHATHKIPVIGGGSTTVDQKK